MDRRAELVAELVALVAQDLEAAMGAPPILYPARLAHLRAVEVTVEALVAAEVGRWRQVAYDRAVTPLGGPG